MPLGFWKFSAGDFPKKRGDFVYFCPPKDANEYILKWYPEEAKKGECENGVDAFIKIVAALPGDHVSVQKDGVHINNKSALPGTKPLEVSKDNTYTGIHRITPRNGVDQKNWIVPKGEIWAYTPEWYSYDSRYYGPVKPTGTAIMLRPLVYEDKPNTEVPAVILKLQNKYERKNM